jgi:hypothetical protein
LGGRAEGMGWGSRVKLSGGLQRISTLPVLFGKGME